ncbi:hypothetical protein ELI52_24235 [Rhizobium ruizarguesonis]|nr:hypothetical protein ELI52_24235 [Rhizobium ruizarguesonis]
MSARSSSGRQPARIDRLRPRQSNSSKSVERFCQAKREAVLPGKARSDFAGNCGKRKKSPPPKTPATAGQAAAGRG